MSSSRLVLLARENPTDVLRRANNAVNAGWAPEKEALLSQVVTVDDRSFQKVSVGIPDKVQLLELRDALLGSASLLAAYAILPARSFKVSLAVFDTDSTFINQEVIDEIAAYAGFRKEVSEITERAMQGKLDFNAALRERVLLLKGLSADVLAEIRRTRLSLTRGAAEFTAWLHQNKAATYLLSGGFSVFTSAFRQDLELTGDFANELEIVDGRLTGRTVGSIVNRERKAVLFRELMQKHKVPAEQTIAVGDGANDIDMAKAAGLGIAFCAKPALLKETFSALFERDLRLIRYLIAD